LTSLVVFSDAASFSSLAASANNACASVFILVACANLCVAKVASSKTITAIKLNRIIIEN
jgi:hypothetical protein